MHLGNLTIEPAFDPNELLYRRFSPEHIQDGGFLPAAFPFPRLSLNRSKFSELEDVLHPDCCNGRALSNWGIVAFAARDLPTPIPGADDRQFDFSLKHVPLECCYAHSEIFCEADGVEIPKPSAKVRERFRVELALRSTIRKYPAT
ncbi:MAG: hypothetical protein ABL995_04600 [Bryobacteraceae bacterium]